SRNVTALDETVDSPRPAISTGSSKARITFSDVSRPGIGEADSHRTYSDFGTRRFWAGASVCHALAYSLAAIWRTTPLRKITGSPSDLPRWATPATAIVAKAVPVATAARTAKKTERCAEE